MKSVDGMDEEQRFAYLMALVASEKVVHLFKENERLQKTSAAVVPADLDQKCIAIINSAFE